MDKGMCGCKRRIQRNNCPQCEGTGVPIDFGRIHRERGYADGLKAGAADKLLGESRDVARHACGVNYREGYSFGYRKAQA